MRQGRQARQGIAGLDGEISVGKAGLGTKIAIRRRSIGDGVA